MPITLTSLFTHKNIQESWEAVQAMLKSAPFRDVIDYLRVPVEADR